jgi:predicted RecA/RadA family phage recombinase
MLSPDSVASQGPGGFLSLNGGPTDPYYALPDGSAYATVADACDTVPAAARRNRTVNVAGIGEMWWLEADLSDNGLVVKVGNSAPGGGGGTSLTDTLSYDVTEDGEQTIQLPASATGIAQVQKQTPIPTKDGSPPTTGYTEEVNAGHTAFEAATRTLTIVAAADLKAGQNVTVTYLYGGSSSGGDTGTGGKVQAENVEGVFSLEQLPPADDAYIEQLFEALKSRMDQRYTQQ